MPTWTVQPTEHPWPRRRRAIPLSGKRTKHSANPPLHLGGYCRNRSLEEIEFFRDINNVPGLQAELLAFLALEDAFEVEVVVLGVAVLNAQHSNRFGIGFGIIKPAGFHHRFQGRHWAVGCDLAGPEHRARHINRE